MLIRRVIDIMGRKVLTQHIRPPIPTTRFDWTAWVDGEEELGVNGFGATEKEAIHDLKTEILNNEADAANQRNVYFAG